MAGGGAQTCTQAKAAWEVLRAIPGESGSESQQGALAHDFFVSYLTRMKESAKGFPTKCR